MSDDEDDKKPAAGSDDDDDDDDEVFVKGKSKKKEKKDKKSKKDKKDKKHKKDKKDKKEKKKEKKEQKAAQGRAGPPAAEATASTPAPVASTPKAPPTPEPRMGQTKRPAPSGATPAAAEPQAKRRRREAPVGQKATGTQRPDFGTTEEDPDEQDGDAGGVREYEVPDKKELVRMREVLERSIETGQLRKQLDILHHLSQVQPLLRDIRDSGIGRTIVKLVAGPLQPLACVVVSQWRTLLEPLGHAHGDYAEGEAPATGELPAVDLGEIDLDNAALGPAPARPSPSPAPPAAPSPSPPRQRPEPLRPSPQPAAAFPDAPPVAPDISAVAPGGFDPSVATPIAPGVGGFEELTQPEAGPFTTQAGFGTQASDTQPLSPATPGAPPEAEHRRHMRVKLVNALIHRYSEEEQERAAQAATDAAERIVEVIEGMNKERQQQLSKWKLILHALDNPGNDLLRRRVIGKELDPFALHKMTPTELAPPQVQREREERVREALHEMQKPAGWAWVPREAVAEQAEESQGAVPPPKRTTDRPCPKCNATDCTFHPLRRAEAKEGAEAGEGTQETAYNCLKCGNHWTE